MKSEAMVIDADGHILEPPDLWEKYTEPKYRDRAIRIRVGETVMSISKSMGIARS
jgi:hypothetical protein